MNIEYFEYREHNFKISFYIRMYIININYLNFSFPIYNKSTESAIGTLKHFFFFGSIFNKVDCQLSGPLLVMVQAEQFFNGVDTGPLPDIK